MKALLLLLLHVCFGNVFKCDQISGGEYAINIEPIYCALIYGAQVEVLARLHTPERWKSGIEGRGAEDCHSPLL